MGRLYTRGECLTIDFHATLIYSSAPPSRAFFVPARPARSAAERPPRRRTARSRAREERERTLLLSPASLSLLRSRVVPRAVLPPLTSRGRGFMEFQDDSFEDWPRATLRHRRFPPDFRTWPARAIVAEIDARRNAAADKRNELPKESLASRDSRRVD